MQLTKKRGISLGSIKKEVMNNWVYYAMLFLPVCFYIIFWIAPLFGIQIAFRNYSARLGIWGSPWVGLKQFETFLSSPLFFKVIRNTLSISVYLLLAGCLPPIILALLMNDLRNIRFRKFVQFVTYAPNFISTVVVIGIVQMLFKEPTGLITKGGLINTIILALGGKPVEFLIAPEWTSHLYVWSHIWQYMGFASIIYMATLSGVNPELYEAATIDGAGRFQRMIHISLPSLIPPAAIIFILDSGKIMSVGFERILLLQNSLNIETSEVISTYVYKLGLGSGRFSYATAVDLFNGVINLAVILSVNALSRRVSEQSLW